MKRKSAQTGPSEQQDRQKKVRREQDAPTSSSTRIQTAIEQILPRIVDTVLNGIPTLSIDPVHVVASRLLEKDGGDAQAAIRTLQECLQSETEVAATISCSSLLKCSEIFLSRILPVTAFGTRLSRTLYCNLRSAALVAELCGYDTHNSVEVRNMLIFCLIPGVGKAKMDSAGNRYSCDAQAAPFPHGMKWDTAKNLCRGLAKTAFQRVTGLLSASTLLDLSIEMLGSSATSTSDDRAVQQAVVRRAVTLFQPQSRVAGVLWLPLLVIGSVFPSLVLALSLASRDGLALSAGAIFMLGLLALLLRRCPAIQMSLMERCKQWNLFSSTILLGHALLPCMATLGGTKLIVVGARPALHGLGSGILLCILGTWSCLRTFLKCSGRRVAWQDWPSESVVPGTGSLLLAGHHVLLGILVLLGACDAAGPGGLQLHAWMDFGTAETPSWFNGVAEVVALECQLQLLQLLKRREVLLHIFGATRTISLSIGLLVRGITSSASMLLVPLSGVRASYASPPQSKQKKSAAAGEACAFLDQVAPPPLVVAIVLRLRADNAVWAMMLGALLAVLLEARQTTFVLPAAVLLAVGTPYLVNRSFFAHSVALSGMGRDRLLLLIPDHIHDSSYKACQNVQQAATRMIWNMALGVVQERAHRCSWMPRMFIGTAR